MEQNEKREIYLDNSATTRPLDEVTELVCELMKNVYGNPSSLHGMGLDAERCLKTARKRVANSLGADSSEIFFTSGGTESDNSAIFCAAASRGKKKRIITSEVEHPAVLEACKRLAEREDVEISLLGVNEKGLISCEELKNALGDDVFLVSIMAVNNESGARMPVEKAAETVREYNAEHGGRIFFHCDMVQSFGKLGIDLKNVDLASVASHKIHGPKGVGALYVKKGLHLAPFIYGGGQEGHFRSGTENVPAIAGFGLAAERAAEGLSENGKKLKSLRKKMIYELSKRIDAFEINGPAEGDELCPSVLNVSFIGTRAEVLLHSLEGEGVYVSSGSACSSNHKNSKGSHVLRAMGLGPDALGSAIRFSFSPLNSEEELELAAEITAGAVTRLRKLGSFR